MSLEIVLVRAEAQVASEQEAIRYLQQVADGLASKGLSIRWELLKGDPDSAVAPLAQELSDNNRPGFSWTLGIGSMGAGQPGGRPYPGHWRPGAGHPGGVGRGDYDSSGKSEVSRSPKAGIIHPYPPALRR